MIVTCDRARTDRRFSELKSYMDEHVLEGDNFLCSHRDECRASCKVEFLEGQLNHVGRYYDLSYDGRPHRVIVVGQECGLRITHESLSARRARVVANSREKRFKAEGGHPGRNPHMKGTTTALRLLHGIDPGEDYDGEFIEIADVGRTHLFETYSLVNYLLCSAVKPGTVNGQSTRTMKRNCGRHFRETLEILSPTVIVIQGKGLAKWITAQLPGYETLESGLGRCKLSDHPVTIVPLSHPSARGMYRWAHLSSEYLGTTVRPLLGDVWRAVAGLP